MRVGQRKQITAIADEVSPEPLLGDRGIYELNIQSQGRHFRKNLSQAI